MIERPILFEVDKAKFIPLNREAYHDFVKQVGDKPLLVLISAAWCPDCRNLYPLLDEVLFGEFKDKFVVRYMNTDDNRGFARELEVFSIPTIIVYRNAKEISRIKADRMDYDSLAEYLEQLL